jgi:hypothetical protein
MKRKLSDIKDLIHADSISQKDGVYLVRKGFFYTHGKGTEDFETRVKEIFPEAIILDSGEVWKPFRGGASVGKQSHWWVKFKLPNNENRKVRFERLFTKLYPTWKGSVDSLTKYCWKQV